MLLLRYIDASAILYAFVLLFTGTMMLALGMLENDMESKWVFLSSSVIVLSCALCMYPLAKKATFDIRTMIFAISTVWIILPAFCALPFILQNHVPLTFSQAFFEAVSCLTTTGASVISQPENLSNSLLIWRGGMQWIGGLGVVIFFSGLLLRRGAHSSNIKGVAMFQYESASKASKLFNTFAQMQTWTIVTYCLISLLCFVSLLVSGLDAFTSLVHTLSTVSTGGMSSSSQSIAGLNNHAAEYVIMCFMLISAMPFSSIPVLLMRKRSIDPQIKTFFYLLLVGVFLIYMWTNVLHAQDVGLKDIAFSVSSALTGTGFSIAYFTDWGYFPVTVMTFLALCGGCMGSTSCGLKIFRLQIAFKAIRQGIITFTQPMLYHKETYNGTSISSSLYRSALAFIFIYLCILVVVITMLMFIADMDKDIALSAAVSALSNLGVGLEASTGHGGSYADLPDRALWILSLAMIAGRLECLTFLAILYKRFWQ